MKKILVVAVLFGLISCNETQGQKDYAKISGKITNPVEGQAETIDRLLYARIEYAYGDQEDYFDHWNCAAWVRKGTEEHPGGCAVVLSDGDAGYKDMSLGEDKAGKTYVDCLNNRTEKVTLDENGSARFQVNERSISVWIPEKE